MSDRESSGSLFLFCADWCNGEYRLLSRAVHCISTAWFDSRSAHVKANHQHWTDKAINLVNNPQISFARINWLYLHSYYDGPISGRVRLESPEGSEVLWAEVFEECNYNPNDVDSYHGPCGFYRRYKLIRLTPEANAEERRRQAIFEEYVGTHWSYPRGSMKPISEHGKYYEQHKSWKRWTPEGKVIGWFQI